MRGVKKAIADYWYENYVSNGHCALCGNCGSIDTTSMTNLTKLGIELKKWPCICPNGQLLRKWNKEAEEYAQVT